MDEESGILISAMLRQYFMSLRTVGRWKNLADHWNSVGACPEIPIIPGKPTTHDSSTDSIGTPKDSQLERLDTDESAHQWRNFLQSKFGLKTAPINDNLEEGEQEEEEKKKNDDPDAMDGNAMDIEILLLRKFFHRWAKKAGVQIGVADPLRDMAMLVDWTRTIAPVIDGRIKMVEA